MALTEIPETITGDRTLQVDHFGLSIGSLSVGLPSSCTADDVYCRYLDLMAILQRGPMERIVAPPGDLAALAAATSTDAAFVARRLGARQRR